MTEQEKKQLSVLACKIRLGIVEGTYHAKSGHPGGSLGAAELFAYLYGKELRIDPAKPDWPQRDRFVLSKGHAAPGLYAALAERGFFSPEDLKTLRQIGSHLQGHPNMRQTPGVDMSTGSLGQGVSCAVGMALGAKYRAEDMRVYTLLGDGEIAEGQVWEAAMAAAHYRLDNLMVIVDVNGLQIDGATKDVMNSEPLDKKFAAFGFAVFKADGHDFEQLEEAFDAARQIKGRPSALLAKTVKGKGVGFMENQAGWHGKAPNAEEYGRAMAELRAEMARREAM